MANSLLIAYRSFRALFLLTEFIATQTTTKIIKQISHIKEKRKKRTREVEISFI